MKVKIVIMPNRTKEIELSDGVTIDEAIKMYAELTSCQLKDSHSVSVNGNETSDMNRVLNDGDRIIASQNIDKAVSIKLPSGIVMQLDHEGTIEEIITVLEDSDIAISGAPFVNDVLANNETIVSENDTIEFRTSGLVEIIKMEGEYGKTQVTITLNMTINEAIQTGLRQLGYENYNTDEFSVFDFASNPSRSYSPQTRTELVREGMSLTISTKEKQAGG